MAKTIQRTDHSNNFDQLRFIAASLVILSHCFPLTQGSNANEILNLFTGNLSLGTLSVFTFFFISGYLITKSWNNQPKLLNFSLKRILRIYPGLIAVILFSTFFIGPIVSSLDVNEYFLSLNVFSLIKNMMLLYQADLPGVFNNNIYPIAVNGSLWTLILEASMYITTIFLGMSKILTKKWYLIIFLFFEIVLNNFVDISKTRFIWIVINKFAVYYLIGMCYFIFGKKIKYNFKLCILLLLVWILSFKTYLFDYVSYISIPYLIFSIAFVPRKYLPRFTGDNDYSYGLYIYAFPIQQTIVHFSNNHISILTLFLLSYPLTLFMAFLSWNYIEKKALNLKNINFSDFNLYQKTTLN